MKRGTIEHPKTEELAVALNVPLLHAVGILESLWHWCAKYARDGALTEFKARTIARGIHYEGDADALISALVSSRWLDQIEGVGLFVHDWHDHAEESVKKTLANNGQRFWNGSKPFAKRSRKRTETVATVSGLPKPKPKPKPKPLPSSTASAEPPPADVTEPCSSQAEQEAKPPRKRNELFDAVAEVTGSDPAVSASHIGKLCKLLKSAEPPYTPAEVRQFGELVIAEGWCAGKPSLGLMEKKIGNVRDAEHIRAVQRGPPGRNGADSGPDPIQAYKRKILGEGAK